MLLGLCWATKLGIDNPVKWLDEVSTGPLAGSSVKCQVLSQCEQADAEQAHVALDRAMIVTQ